jgi:hypothetical protein
MRNKKRNYGNDYPSVTEILSILRKPGLEQWYKLNTKDFVDEESKKSRDYGTFVHSVIEKFIATGVVDKTEISGAASTAIDSFSFFLDLNPDDKFANCETKMTSTKFKFNGTSDAIGFSGVGKKVLFDWKTSGGDLKIYDEYIAQVSAYVWLCGESGAPVDGAKIVVLSRAKTDFIVGEYSTPELIWYFENLFLPALQIYNAQKTIKNNKKIKKREEKNGK